MNTRVDAYDISGSVDRFTGLWGFNIALVDWNRNVELTTYGDAQDYLGRFQEQVIPFQFFGDERGYWSVDFVPTPEPSTLGLAVLGILSWWGARHAATRISRPPLPTTELVQRRHS